MKRNELIELRGLVNDEIKRRERITELLQNDFVMEYLDITKTKPVKLDINNISEIISKILSSFIITTTNGIYVCTNAWCSDYTICYEDTEYYPRNVDINSKYAEYRIYTDIESRKTITAVKDEKEGDNRPLISDFEANNIVLNPHNSNENQNGYNEVRFDFIETAIKYGQAKAKRLVLTKYPRI